MLSRDFYLRPATELAPLLLGKLLCRDTPEGRLAGRIVEAEAYMGPEDRGAHSFGGKRTERTAVQYGPGGFAYVYLIYGLHCLFNIVAADLEQPQVVLIRALEPVEGVDRMARRRGRETELCSGPGKLCTALDITRDLNGADLCAGPLYLEDAPALPPERIAVSPRINIDYAGEYRDMPWRFYAADSPYVSKVPARYKAVGTLADRKEGTCHA